jgi:hypothetical protein
MRLGRRFAVLGALIGAVAVSTLSSCGGDGNGGTGPSTPTPTTLQLAPTTVTLTYIGATASMTSKILDQNGSPLTGAVAWTSDDPAVASVSTTGVITAAGNGTTTVRAASGSLSASVAVTVQQTVTSLEALSGDAQSALAGEALGEVVAVRANDLGGSPVAGATVTFSPDQGSGTVDPASAVTAADGKASTTWTMGTAFGPQRLTVSSASAIRTFTASSLSPVPLPDLVTDGTLSVQRPDPSTLETVTVQTKVSNTGDAVSGAFRVHLLSNGQEIATENQSSLAPGAERTVTFVLEPFAAGTHALQLEVDADAVVEELIESNNAVSKAVTVVQETLLQGAQTLNNLGAVTDVELRYRLDLPAAANNLTIELTGGTGDVDLFVERGERPSTREAYNDCQSGGPTTAERCQLTGIEAGSYFILLHAFSTFSGTTMTISLDGEVLPYNLEVVFIDHGTPRQDSAVTLAAQRWMSILPVDVPDSDFSSQPLAAGACTEGHPGVSDIVDDIRIFVAIKDIDGPGGTLAQAAPCVTRGLGHLPIIGFMEFDSADMVTLDQNDALQSVVLHEMAHVLGLGTIWGTLGFVQNPSLPSSSGADTHFDGPRAIAAFNEVGGTNYTQGSKVPVENKAAAGSSDSHWRESVMGVELMTPFFNPGTSNPLSVVSVRSMEDLGYQVDATKADSYTGFFSAPSRLQGAPQQVIDLGGDVARVPIRVVDQKGRVLEIRY